MCPQCNRKAGVKVPASSENERLNNGPIEPFLKVFVPNSQYPDSNRPPHALQCRNHLGTRSPICVRPVFCSRRRTVRSLCVAFLRHRVRIEESDMSHRIRLLYGLALGVALLTTGLFTAHAARHVSELRPGAVKPIRPWMSIPQIARVQHVPPQLLFDTLQLSPEQGKPRPISAIARSQHRSIDRMIDDLQLAIGRYRQPPLPPDSLAPRTPEFPATPTPAATSVPPRNNT